jgi:hypothetical protein
LKADTVVYFKSLIEFLELEVYETLIREAVQYSSFENMHKIEKDGHVPTYKSSGLPIFGTGDRNNPNAFHVRRGKIGGYRDEFSSEDSAKYRHQIREELDSWYGYNCEI